MKKSVWLTGSLVTATVIALVLTRPQQEKTKDGPQVVEDNAAPTEADLPEVSSVRQPTHAVIRRTSREWDTQPVPNTKVAQPPVFEQALNTLISAQATYQEKQAAWGQLRNAGKLDQVMNELEQRIAGNPSAPENHAALGQACLQKAGTIQDIREQGILGMKADQSFEAALNLDPQNWEARFWKATAMSYWPPQLGKGKEVIEQCLELLKQQEVRPPEAQFAQTYVLLGDEYTKQGHPEYATQVWNRGLGLFPTHEALRQRVSAQQ